MTDPVDPHDDPAHRSVEPAHRSVEPAHGSVDPAHRPGAAAASGHAGSDPRSHGTDSTASSTGPARAYEALTDAFGRDLSAAAAAHAARPNRFRQPSRVRRPVIALGGFAAAAALAVVLFFAGAFSASETLLTPDEAVAAAARDLSSDGILRYKTTAPRRSPADAGKTDGGGRDTWIDLKTGARHDRLLGKTVNQLGGRSPSQTWFNGRRTRVAIWGPDFRDRSRLLVMRTIRRRGEKVPDFDNPIAELRRTLALGASGQAVVESAGLIDGRPVAKVTQTKPLGLASGSDSGYSKGTETIQTWITREATPRLVRVTMSYTGQYAASFTQEYTSWELRPRSEAALSHVREPDFDPAKYIVRTQFLGPRKR